MKYVRNFVLASQHRLWLCPHMGAEHACIFLVIAVSDSVRSCMQLTLVLVAAAIDVSTYGRPVHAVLGTVLRRLHSEIFAPLKC